MMKKRLLVFLLLLCVALSACKKSNINKPDVVTDSHSDTQAQIDYVLKYEDVLAKSYEFIKNIDSKVGPDDGMAGIWDAALALENKALDEIGYTFCDLNGDDVSELLIGAFDKTDDAFVNNEIYMIYTLNNDKPEFLLEGRSRSMYSLKDDGNLFYMGSNGAAYSIFGIYNVSKNNEVVCEDYYYTYPDDDDPAKIEIYHNKTGIYFREESEKLDISLDEFMSLQEDASKETIKLSATPFTELDEDIIKKANEKPSVVSADMLDGEWILSEVEVEGQKLTAEEAGLESEIDITSTTSNVTATYFNSTEYATERFEAEVIYVDEPLYYQCENGEWSVKFSIITGDFGEDEEFYATLIDDNTLLLQHLYPFDGAQGLSYQTYIRK